LNVAIGGLSATTVTIGGNEIEFTVTIANPTADTFRNIAPVVSTGHCTCADTPVPTAPDGTLKWRQADGSWKTVQYVQEGSGMDYVNADQVPGLTLTPGATASYTFRMGFRAAQQPSYHNGRSSIDVTMVGLAGGYTATGPTAMTFPPGPGTHVAAVLGSNPSPAASTPIQVSTS